MTAFRSFSYRLKVFFDPIRRKQLSVFIVCLGLSFILWTLTRLSDDMSSSLAYPVQVRDIPPELVLTSMSDSLFRVQVDSKGWHILSLMRMQRVDIPVSVKNVRLTPGKEGGYCAAIPTSGIEEAFAHKVEVSRSGIFLSPDTLYLTFEQTISKEVPLVPRCLYALEDQFYLYEQERVSPSVVTVTGLPSDLQYLDTLYTEVWHGGKLRETQHVSLKIVSPVSRYPLSLSVDSALVTIPLEQFTEAVIRVPITPVNTLNSYGIKIFPEFAEIRYLVALKDYNTINREDFRIEARYDGQASDKIPLKRVYAPEKCKVRAMEPDGVEYIIIK
ncbi:MAG: hypothetical protein CSA95_07675 [Bacteroidetes bacterium]|nr:MAG: hypothetical protein CSA95_07675 [Bacteroidota bacterium]